MLAPILIAVAVMVVILVAVIATRPAAFQIERQIDVAAPAEVAFRYVNDFHKWDAWSPWLQMEPTQKVTHSGSTAGIGAVYEWQGKKTGRGRMEILESRPHELVKIRLDFIKPMKATHLTEFRVTAGSQGVVLSWVMTGHNNFRGKAFSLFMNVDAMVGKDFEKGLAGIKSNAEVDAGSRRDVHAVDTLRLEAGAAVPSKR